MQRILAVEDCQEVCALIECALTQDFCLGFAGCLAEAREMLAQATPDLVLLDVNLPDGAGYELCSELQNRPETRDVPVFFLTGCTGVQAKVTAFQIGADDYIEKPFHPDELRARVSARLRKLSSARDRHDRIVCGALQLEVSTLRARLRTPAGERGLDLTTREFRLLACLAREPGRVFSRERLIRAIAEDIVVSPRTIDSHLSHIRAKLAGGGPAIESVRGAGYRLVVAPT